jgi:hypothetical protein
VDSGIWLKPIDATRKNKMTTNKYNRVEDRHFWNYKDITLPNCIIVDIDGTLALFGMENPYDRDYSKDFVNPALQMFIQIFVEHHREKWPVFIVSGRTESRRQETTDWLFNNYIPYASLFMRKDGDSRKDDIIKEEIYNTEIKDKYNVICAFDDRKRIKRMWNKNGIYVFDVNQTDLEY